MSVSTRIKLKGAKGIGLIIKKGCLVKGIQQKELAKKISLSANTMSEIVRGIYTPSKEIVRKIEKELGLAGGQLESMIIREEDDDKTRYSPSKKERRILEVWDCGRLSPKEVQKETGYSMQVISRYLPVNEDAQYVDC